jgi:hypothetical protein
MNLTEFILKNDIKCVDGTDFSHSPEFHRMKEFMQKCYRINNIPCLIPETYQVAAFDIRLRGEVEEKWDKQQMKTRRQFFVRRSFRYPGFYDDFSTVEDAVEAGKTIDEAVECLRCEIERFLFFRRYGRYCSTGI